jgi:hypothetical protein
MECWNAGILGIKAEINDLNYQKFLQTHYSITPVSHYLLRDVSLPSRRPIGAKPQVNILNILLILSDFFKSCPSQTGTSLKPKFSI